MRAASAQQHRPAGSQRSALRHRGGQAPTGCAPAWLGLPRETTRHRTSRPCHSTFWQQVPGRRTALKRTAATPGNGDTTACLSRGDWPQERSWWFRLGTEEIICTLPSPQIASRRRANIRRSGSARLTSQFTQRYLPSTVTRRALPPLWTGSLGWRDPGDCGQNCQSVASKPALGIELIPGRSPGRRPAGGNLPPEPCR